MNLHAGAAATGLFLGGLGIAAAVALVTAPVTPHLAVAKTMDEVRPAVTVSSMRMGRPPSNAP